MNLAARPEALRPTPSEEILVRLMRLHPKLIDLSLGRLQGLLARLDHPERQLPPVVHVAGTNGKGSTIAFMRAALEAAGHRVHVYTSPHLVRFNERMRLAGELIGDEHLLAVLEACERANGDRPITYFEVTTATAFLAFRDCPADVLLLETGLGGRLDATNVIERPLLTAITTVSLDHQHFLGETLGEIAGEKAGILKPGVPGIIARQEPAAAAAITARAGAIGAPLLCQDADWRIEAVDGHLHFAAADGDRDAPMPGLVGVHQVQNAGLALACLRQMDGFPLNGAHLTAGLLGANWPGRLQRLEVGDLADRLPAGSELWLDGGHNPGAGVALAETLAQWREGEASPRPIFLVTGMLTSKDAVSFLAPFAALSPQVFGVPVPYEDASMTSGQIVEAATAVGLLASPVADVAEALDRIATVSGDGVPPRVLICGTLYLAGSILAAAG
ncbi:MAG: folylpolyglutamate synthase/dihydrofolate synthase family protein [Alphaproteobacteria bacterium]|jgi:dihydrofolate synthase/folylpolyglutamate synthase|nr:folylpolyglutamate synthase/dihydrofolate synthase family protein [Alphaproteobacteria bacterium]MDP6565657.1 folylpolyglutamate synthase/dihydrofolate synthase family protein [Alphaproteobacteria bacterium]MDP6813674.1 folylpolyglutamate synthase/dihydrofolate synthase family protein [Alphaproteobacteria bacterium]